MGCVGVLIFLSPKAATQIVAAGNQPNSRVEVIDIECNHKIQGYSEFACICSQFPPSIQQVRNRMLKDSDAFPKCVRDDAF